MSDGESDILPLEKHFLEVLEYMQKLGSNLQKRSQHLIEKKANADYLNDAENIKKVSEKMAHICTLSIQSLEKIQNNITSVARAHLRRKKKTGKFASSTPSRDKDDSSPRNKTEDSACNVEASDPVASTSSQGSPSTIPVVESLVTVVTYEGRDLRVPDNINFKHFLCCKVKATPFSKSVFDEYMVPSDLRDYNKTDSSKIGKWEQKHEHSRDSSPEGAPLKRPKHGSPHSKKRSSDQSSSKDSSSSTRESKSITDHKHPKHGSPHSKPKNGSHSKPKDGSSHSKPKDGSSHNKPKDGSSHNKPKDGSSHSKPKDGSLSSKSKEGSLSSKSKEGSSYSKHKHGSPHSKPKHVENHKSNRDRGDKDKLKPKNNPEEQTCDTMLEQVAAEADCSPVRASPEMFDHSSSPCDPGTASIPVSDQINPDTNPMSEIDPVSESDPVSEPDPVSKPGPVSENDAASEPNPVSESDPVSEPNPVSESDPVPEPDPVSESDPASELDPVSEADPMSGPEVVSAPLSDSIEESSRNGVSADCENIQSTIRNSSPAPTSPTQLEADIPDESTTEDKQDSQPKSESNKQSEPAEGCKTPQVKPMIKCVSMSKLLAPGAPCLVTPSPDRTNKPRKNVSFSKEAVEIFSPSQVVKKIILSPHKYKKKCRSDKKPIVISSDSDSQSSESDSQSSESESDDRKQKLSVVKADILAGKRLPRVQLTAYPACPQLLQEYLQNYGLKLKLPVNKDVDRLNEEAKQKVLQSSSSSDDEVKLTKRKLMASSSESESEARSLISHNKRKRIQPRPKKAMILDSDEEIDRLTAPVAERTQGNSHKDCSASGSGSNSDSEMGRSQRLKARTGKLTLRINTKNSGKDEAAGGARRQQDVEGGELMDAMVNGAQDVPVGNISDSENSRGEASRSGGGTPTSDRIKSDLLQEESSSSSPEPDPQEEQHTNLNGDKQHKDEDESADSEEETKSKRKSKKKRLKSDSPMVVLDSEEDEEEEEEKESSSEEEGKTAEEEGSGLDEDEEIFKPARRKRKPPPKNSDDDDEEDKANKGKKKRRRIKKMSGGESSEGSGGSGAGSGSDGEEGGKRGRKNIRRLKSTNLLDSATREAGRKEKERLQRIAERQKLYNESMFDESARPNEAVKLDKVVLDFDPETKEPTISLDCGIVEKLKPHQANGVKFMWDACFESVKQIKHSKGSGCILAHCMGLGKTLQVVSLVHTLLIHQKQTRVQRVLVVCPLSTVLNWVNEFRMWLEHAHSDEDVNIYELSRFKKNYERAAQLKDWLEEGGVCVLGYEMFRNLSADNNKKFRKPQLTAFQKALVDPGPDLVVCDEGHLLKNEKTSLSQSMNKVKTLRRIVLTGTPLQNNLKEYYCMVQFVKPNLLGKYNEYMNRFVNPITNGQYTDSTEHDIKIMKRRSHVLHKMLDGAVQRRDYAVLAPFLPPKHEYVLFVSLTEIQVKLYQYYLDNFSRRPRADRKGTGFLFPDFQSLQRIWTHPLVLKANSERYELLQQKKRDKEEEEDSEGSLVDFIDDEEDTSTPEETSESDSSEESDDNRRKKKKKKKNKEPKVSHKRNTRSNIVQAVSDEDDDVIEVKAEDGRLENPTEWWISLCKEEELDDVRHSNKLMLLLDILKECDAIGDKLLVFSQSLYSLDLIEQFLAKIDEATQHDKDKGPDTLAGHTGSWTQGLDYFRLDGQTSCENRALGCKSFNREDNPRARLFLISTRAGGLGINLVAANRVVIFDMSWNPSHDVQSIFRIYRFGQKKPCYIYRFLALGTMEEKIYERQVTKQAISKRVIDEQQIDRHYAESDLAELYTFCPVPEGPREVPKLPKDRLFADLLQAHDKVIYKYHEADSLLENKEEETLTEEERKAAWEDYENEKTRPPPTTFGGQMMLGFQQQQQQTALAMSALTTMLRQEFPNVTDQQLSAMLPALVRQVYQNGDIGTMQKLAMMGQQQNTFKYPQANMTRPPMYMNAGMDGLGGVGVGVGGVAGGGVSMSNPVYQQAWQQQQQMQLQRLQQQQAANMKYYAGGLGSRDTMDMVALQQRQRELLLGASGHHSGRNNLPISQPPPKMSQEVVDLDSE